MHSILSPLERFGRFHFVLWMMLSMQMLLLAFNNMSMVFFHDTPPHHCKISEDRWLNESLPPPEVTTSKQPFSSCRRYRDADNHSLGTEPCQSYEYDISEDGITVVSEFDVVCDWKFLPSLISTLYFGGMVLGDAVFGPLADRFGRKPLILIGMYCQIAIGFGLYFTQSLNLYIALRVLLGLMTEGIFGTSITILMEFTPTHLRGHASTVFSAFWPLGAFYVGTSAYLLRDWRWVQLTLILPFLLSCIYLWWLPESVRWLLSKNRVEEATAVATRFARLNGTRLKKEEKGKDVDVATTKSEAKTKTTYSYLDLIRTREMRHRVLISLVIWFCMAFCYYGIVFSTGSLSGDKYANFLIGIGLELVAYIVTIGFVGRIKRKIFFLVTVGMAGVLCLAAVFLKRFGLEDEFSIAALILILLSKAFLVSSFVVMKAFTPELMPTVVRNMGMSSNLLTCRVGALVAPQVASLGEYTDPLVPFIIYGIAFLGGGSLAYFLPETKDKPMPETISDVEQKNQTEKKG